jgi:hypothetical protein
MVFVGASADCPNCHLYSSGCIEWPNPIPLRLRSSPGRRHLLPKPHRVSSHILCEGHLASSVYRRNHGNNTHYFLIPVIVVTGVMYLVLPFNLFLAMTAACTVSFGVHVFLDKQYHAERTRLARFAWFRRKQQLHFVHLLHANSNFAVIDFFWDRVLGTYRNPDTL